MRLATVSQSREMEEITQNSYEISSELLMESAGALAARELEQAYFPELKRGQLSLLCGPGHNGGDGLVMARHLHSMGHRHLVVYLLSPPQQRTSELFVRQLRRVQLQGLRLIDLFEHPEKRESLKSSALIVDALFGTGISRPIEGLMGRTVEIINSTRTPVVSLDCPSGLNGNNGLAQGPVVKADMTITFGLAKPGFFVADGPRNVGRLRVLPIGFPREVIRGVSTTHFAFTEKLSRRYLPRRPESSYKGDFGHLLLVAGSPGMWGAGLLSAASAYRLGCGYVTWASIQNPEEFIKDIPEVLTASIKSPHIWDKKWNAVAVGPGLGVSDAAAEFIKRLKEKKITGVVLDADAINVCVQYQLFPLPKQWVLTPHAGELERILQLKQHKMPEDRFQAALLGAELTGCHLLFKGFRSVLAYEDRCLVINSGNSALAKAGSGDVLTGMIGSLLAQGLESLPAAATGAYIHGRLADDWVRLGADRRSLLPSDLKDQLPQLLSRITVGTNFF